MYLTQKNHLRLDREQYEVVKRLTKLSKNLYNYTLYTVRQYFIANDEFLPYEQAYHMVKDNENYKLLPSQVAQQTMKVVERNMRALARRGSHVLAVRADDREEVRKTIRNNHWIVLATANNRGALQSSVVMSASDGHIIYVLTGKKL